LPSLVRRVLREAGTKPPIRGKNKKVSTTRIILMHTREDKYSHKIKQHKNNSGKYKNTTKNPQNISVDGGAAGGGGKLRRQWSGAWQAGIAERK
jgi:hypothetical protein